MVEPPNPLEGGELHVFQPAPGAAAVDHLRLEEPETDSARALIVGIAPAAHGRLIARFCEPLGVPDREVLHSSIAVVHQPVLPCFLPLTDGLLQRVECQIGPQRARDPRREKTSMTKATYTKPRQVAT